MGLLATLPRATRGHLGAANRALTRATRGYLQLVGVARRRVSGGLFAPKLPETEPFRRITSVLIIGLDGNSDFAFGDEDTHNEILVGRAWLDGGSTFTAGRREPRLRVVEPGDRVEPWSSPHEMAKPVSMPHADSTPSPGQLRPEMPSEPEPARPFQVTLSSGLVLTGESKIVRGKAPTPVRADLEGGSLWLDGESRFTLLELDIPETETDEELALIIAMLQELL